MIAGFLNPFTAQSVGDWLAIGFFYGGFVVAVVYRLVGARSIFIRRFEAPLSPEFDADEVAKHIAHLVTEYEEVHTRELLTAAGARSGLTKPRLAAEGVGAAAVRWIFSDDSGVSILYVLLNWILPVRELVGDVSAGEFPRTVSARIRTDGRFQKGVLASGSAALQSYRDDALKEAASQITYQLLLSGGKELGLRRTESPGTDEWEALRSLTKALEAWSRTKDLPDGLAAEVEAKLDEALHHDPGYPLAHYNKGVFCYAEKAGAAANKEALQHFREACDAARTRLRDAQGRVGGRADTRLLGLSSIGLARACSQEVHRYGYLRLRKDHDPDAISESRERRIEARQAAAEAVTYLPGDPQAAYADAFAWHCTVSDGLTDDELSELRTDLDEGRERYESVVSARKLPGWRRREGKYRVIHNNLGYVLMMGGEVRANEARDAGARGSKKASRYRRDAQSWWKKAEIHMRIAIAVSPEEDKTAAYSCANLGNLQRLRGQLVEAERSYAEAIERWETTRALHPSDSGPEVYVEGLAERARLFVEVGNRLTDALADHRLALSAAEPGRQRFKIARMFLIACERAGRLAPESLESATEWLSEDGSPDLDRWMERMGSLLAQSEAESDPEGVKPELEEAEPGAEDLKTGAEGG